MERRVRGGSRSRYSKREVDVDSNTSCGSEDASVDLGVAATAAVFASGLPLFLVEVGRGSAFLLVPTIVYCLKLVFQICSRQERASARWIV
mmetsp:Transcript_38732/g.69837  ORF Transcript_38732/g.69837 Transcript_38732/m.69837 type:complete len:91 (+) Transcript_38732:1722-1994(+)